MGDAEGPGGAGAREPYVPSDSVWGTFWSALGDSALNLAERLPLVNHLVDGEGARQRLLDRGVSASTLATSEGLFDVSTELLATAATGGAGKLAKGATKIYNLANKGEAAIDGVQAAAQGDARGAVLAAASFLPARKGKNPVSKTLGAVDPDDAAKLSGPVRRGAKSALHHPFPKYLGGAIDQTLKELPQSLHYKFHSALDKFKGGIYSRRKGAASFVDIDRETIIKDLTEFYKTAESGRFKQYLPDFRRAVGESGF